MPRPYLAERLIQLNTDSWQVSPDGRMQTTWKLRQGIKWHDGAPLTAADLAFTWEVLRDPSIPGNRTAAAQTIEKVVATDEQTVVISWRTTFYRALFLDVRDFWPLPEHLLGQALAQLARPTVSCA